MRLNQWLARATGMSRRAADEAIKRGEVSVAGKVAKLGVEVAEGDTVALNARQLTLPKLRYIAFHKPVGYICTRERQGNSKTIYDLLPPELHGLKSIGRLDKDSSGLLVLTNDGVLAQNLSHPKSEKSKQYRISLNRALSNGDHSQIEDGVMLDDGISKFAISGEGRNWTATLREGRNRQIRRTFAALGYEIIRLHRTSFGKLELKDLPSGQFRDVALQELA